MSQPGREFIIQAGNGDWEFFFSEDAKDVVHGCCIREGRTQFLSSTLEEYTSYLRPLFFMGQQSLSTAVRYTNGPLALTYKAQEFRSNVTLLEVTE